MTPLGRHRRSAKECVVTATPLGSPAAPTNVTGDVAANMLSTVFGNLFPPLAMLISAPLLAHALGVDGRGAVAAANAPLVLATTIATLGVPNAVTYVVARSPGAVRRVTTWGLWLILAAGLVSTVTVALASRILAGDDPEITGLIVVAALAIVPTLLLSVIRGTASGLHQWGMVAQERIVSAAIRLITLLVLMLTSTLNPLTATIITATGPVFGGLVYLRLRSVSPRREDAPRVPGRLLLSYGFRTWIGAISGVLLLRLDQTVMTPLAGAYELGLYAVAATIADVPLIINSAVRDVTFSADAAESTDARLGASARISFTASGLLGLFTGVTMIWWLPLLFGREFAPALPSAALLIAASVLGTPGSIAGAGLAARGHPGLRSASLAAAALISVFALLILVPRYGAVGGALATLLGALVASNGNIIFLWKLHGVSPRIFYGFRRSDLDLVFRFSKRMLRRLRPGLSGGT